MVVKECSMSGHGQSDSPAGDYDRTPDFATGSIQWCILARMSLNTAIDALLTNSSHSSAPAAGQGLR